MRRHALTPGSEDRRSVLLPKRPTRREGATVAGVAVGTLLLATVLAAFLEGPAVGIEDASPVYLIAVVAVGAIAGMWAALGTAIVAFLIYDVLFTDPRGSLVVSDAREWLDLLLFLFVAIVIGRLVSIQHARAEEATRRAAEANSLFALSRALAVAGSTDEAAAEIAARLLRDARLTRVVILVGAPGTERPIADTSPGSPLITSAILTTLARSPGDEPARWVRTHARGGQTAPAAEQYRIHISGDGGDLGAIIAFRDRGAGVPNREETRILALAADQLASSLRRDQLRRTAVELEVARQGDVLKTALIDSVSHDLRTPLASIRATAGGLADSAVPWTDEGRRTAAALIDAEATRLDGLVRGLLDLGRVASGALHPDLEPHEPWAIIRPAIDRLRPALGDRPLQVDVPVDLPPILADAALLDIVITNVIDNAARHAPTPAPVSVTAGVTVDLAADGISEPTFRLIVADGGPGVPPAMLGRLFDRFERPGGGDPGSSGRDTRPGLGIGLSVVKGLTEAMGGTVSAAPSDLGGLAVTITLRIAAGPEEGR